MDLERFLTECASDGLLGAFAAAHARTKAGMTRTYLANILDQLLEEESIRSRIPEPVRTRARAAMAVQIRAMPSEPSHAGELAFDLAALIDPALELMGDLGASDVTPLLLLGACISSVTEMDPASQSARDALRLAGITAEMFLPGATDRARRQDFTFRSHELGADGLGTDMTAKARAGVWPICPLIGMERELENLVVLLNSMRNSAVIVGEPGVGKSALVDGFAWHVVHRSRPLIPPDMDDWTVVRIEAADLLKGTSGRGELETRVKDMLGFFARNPKVVPFFEEMHKLLDTDDTTSRAVATAFKVPMAEGLFRCVGATTDREYARFIASDDAMNARFRKILIQEPTEEVACRIVANSRDNLLRNKASQLGIDIQDDAIHAAVKVTSVYQRGDRLPRKAINLLSETVSDRVYRLSRTDSADQPGPLSPSISGEDVRRLFGRISGIPVNDLKGDRSDYYRRLESLLGERVRGQSAALAAVTRHLSLYAQGFVDQRRPRGRFLFVGPPGVGKTELALSLAQEIMHDRGSLVVMNMADHAKEDALSKFMGASPGYVGFGETPTLYSKIMMRPYSVVVLDEFEKAASVLVNPLISIFDGKADDSQGRPVDFSQCIFVMTSNSIVQRDLIAGAVFEKLCDGSLAVPVRVRLGLQDVTVSYKGVMFALERLSDIEISVLIEEMGGIDEEAMRGALVALGGVWTQPLVDRIDRVVVFNSLGREALEGILERMIEERRTASGRPLPAGLDTPEARATIIDWATSGTSMSSARRLERSLLRWLSEAVIPA